MRKTLIVYVPDNVAVIIKTMLECLVNQNQQRLEGWPHVNIRTEPCHTLEKMEQNKWDLEKTGAICPELEVQGLGWKDSIAFRDTGWVERRGTNF